MEFFIALALIALFGSIASVVGMLSQFLALIGGMVVLTLGAAIVWTFFEGY